MNKRSWTSRLYLCYGIVLIPLIIFGFYKNGILLYMKNYVDFLGMLKPLIIILMGLCGVLLGTVLKEYRDKKTLTRDFKNKCKGPIIEALLITMILPLKSSPIIVFFVTLIFAAFLSETKINRVALMYIVIQGVNALLGLNSFSNPYESSTVLNYNAIDLFLGSGTGGICSTSIIIIIFGLIFLSFNKLYKRDLVLSAILSFSLLVIVPNMLGGSYERIFSEFFGYNILYSFVLIAPNLYSSSYTVKGQILSGVVLGILTYFIMIIMPYNAAIISILVVNLLNGIFDRIFVIK